MAYETASASSVNDLLDKLRVFALANGWSVDYWGGRTNPGGGLQAGGNQALLMNKGGLHVYFAQVATGGSSTDPTPYLLTYTYPGPFVSANGTDAQAGKTTTAASNNLPGPFTAYHFFASANYLHACVEVVPGRFSHFHVGELEKAGGGSPVHYHMGLRWNFNSVSPNVINDANTNYHALPWCSENGSANSYSGAIRADSDGVAPRNYDLSSSVTLRALCGWRSASSTLARHFMRVGPSAITGRAPLSPAIVIVERTPGVFSIAGTPRDLRLIRMDNIAPGEVLTIGSDQWKCFPVIRKNGPPGVENSANFGYAYRVVT